MSCGEFLEKMVKILWEKVEHLFDEKPRTEDEIKEVVEILNTSKRIALLRIGRANLKLRELEAVLQNYEYTINQSKKAILNHSSKSIVRRCVIFQLQAKARLEKARTEYWKQQAIAEHKVERFLRKYLLAQEWLGRNPLNGCTALECITKSMEKAIKCCQNKDHRLGDRVVCQVKHRKIILGNKEIYVPNQAPTFDCRLKRPIESFEIDKAIDALKKKIRKNGRRLSNKKTFTDPIAIEAKRIIGTPRFQLSVN